MKTEEEIKAAIRSLEAVLEVSTWSSISGDCLDKISLLNWVLGD